MRISLYVLLGCFFLFACNPSNKKEEKEFIQFCVTATAYNSLEYQTSPNPHITAFGDSLIPGKKYIAVSRDLLKFGLNHNTPVQIEGLEGIYLVKDKMHYRKRNQIDIYMGTDVKAALKWGRRKVNISYPWVKDSVAILN